MTDDQKYSIESHFKDIMQYVEELESTENFMLDNLKNKLLELKETKQEDHFFYWSLLVITLMNKHKLSKKLKKELINKIGSSARDDSFPVYPRGKWYIQIWAEFDPDKYNYAVESFDEYYNKLPVNG